MDLNLLIPLITAALAGGLTGILGAVVAIRRLPIEQKKADIDGAVQLTGAAMGVVKQVRDDLIRTEETNAAIKEEQRETKKELRALRTDFNRQRDDLIQANKKIRHMEGEDQKLRDRVTQLETEKQQLMEMYQQAVDQLVEEQDKRREFEAKLDEEKEKRKLLEGKLDELIKNGQGGQGGASG